MLTTIEGIVQNGMIRLRDNVTLPENARVYVIVADTEQKSASHIRNASPGESQPSQRFPNKLSSCPPMAKYDAERYDPPRRLPM